MQLEVTESFFIAHATPSAGGTGKRVHGHYGHVTFRISGRMDVKTGMVEPASALQDVCHSTLMDFVKDQDANPQVIDLNAIAGIHPTMENFILFLQERLRPKYPGINISLYWWEESEYRVSTDG